MVDCTCKIFVLLILVCGSLFLNSRRLNAVEFEDTVSNESRQTEWKGFEQRHFRVAGRPAYVVIPKQALAGNPWIWRARFPGYHAEMDEMLVGEGYHLGYVDVAGMFGSPRAVAIGDAFYRRMTEKLGLSKRPALEGVSRGGLFVYNWASRNVEKVACIYCDTPVCDFKSWPAGRGEGLGSDAAWKQCLAAYELSEPDALTYQGNPVDNVAMIAKQRVPILHIVSENDQVVPPAENTYRLKQNFEQLGHTLNVISVARGTEASHGHHFTHPQPEEVVAFVLEHASCHGTPEAKETAKQARVDLLDGAERILFLGDSITYGGQYIVDFETWLESQSNALKPTVINAGLPSETVSGLSEDGHAGGRFPRPDLHERLERVLAVVEPDLVIACYGINCGIYQPFDAKRFEKFQAGIEKLKQAVESQGAQIILVTPPTFDDQRSKNAFSYNDVMRHYAEWLTSKRADGWFVIDLHRPMDLELKQQRGEDSEFTFQPDAIHPNREGHRFIASRIVEWFGGELTAVDGPLLRQRLQRRMTLRRDAYLSAAGHQRPGISQGKPLAEANEEAERLTREIRQPRPASSR